jgi:hypothetical protein
MRNRRYVIASILLLGALGAGRATADGTKQVVVVNNTQYTVNELYASGSDSSSWDTSNNLLTGSTIGAGQQSTVNIPDVEGQCDYDLMAVLYGAAQHAYQYQVNACNGDTWTISQ